MSKVPKVQNLLMRIGDQEVSMEVPFGFWDMEREGLRAFIQSFWPGVERASNGQSDMFGIMLRF